MAAAGIDHHQRVSAGGEIICNGLNIRLVLLEIDGHQAAHRAGHLVHQAAGLAKIMIFSVLGDLRPQDGGHFKFAVQAVEDGTKQHFEGRGGAQAAAGEHAGGNRGVKPADGKAQFLHPCRHAPHQGGGFPLFLLDRG
ncbi:hypothetical protein SDC9_190787 [bioreactor metagenome]|uniref:Uncharacterized protein n=1 Tax=bioreactor metagenome TaxID=1076179 RepID=A0A645HW35_9ZZZZ